MRHKIASITQHLRLPVVCVLCHHYHSGHFAVCSACNNLLRQIKHSCTICGLPLPDEHFLQCGYCIKKPPAFDKVFTIYHFEEPLRTLLHEFKYHKALYLKQFLVKLMLDAMPFPLISPGCLVPVPMHAKKLRQRGFNPAAELTKQLAKHLHLPYDLTLCIKKINTVPQASLNRQKRRQNLRTAFVVKTCPYPHVTLIDDLLTTGSTAHELATVLKQQGAQRVDVWCLARA